MSDMTKSEFEEMNDRSEIDTENALIVNSILLARLYDVALLILYNLDEEAAGRLAQKHEEGELLGEQISLRYTSE